MAATQSKLFILLLCAVTLFAPFARAIDVKYCNKKNNYEVKVSGVEINPYPIKRGKETTFTISASTETPISGGNLMIDVSYYFIGVYSETRDLCTKTSCPVAAGNFAISHSQSLPSVTPPGSYTLTMKLHDGKKKELTCITFGFSIGWYISQPALASSMLQMLMDTNLDAKQLDFAQTAHASGKDLIKLINEVLDEAKIESGKLELEAVPFELRTVLDNVVSLLSSKAQEKGIELAVYVSHQLPEVVVCDPGRFRQIITNLVQNSLKFTHDRGHILVSVHLSDEVARENDMKILTNAACDTLSGLPVVDRKKSWEKFENLSGKDLINESEKIRILVTVEDTGVGISEFRGLHALVIDHKNIRAEVTRYHLKRLGISVEITSDFDSAQSYQSAIDLNAFAMILVDQETWDKETGLSFLRGLKSSTKLFLLANSVNPAIQDEIRSANVVAKVVQKPLRLSVLISCIQETIYVGNSSVLPRRKPSALGTLLRDKRILVVDDNVVNRRVVEGALKKYGSIVTCVDSGKAALEKLKPPHSFDACFMDLQMPEMDGFEATRQIRRVESVFKGQWHTPILAMTADVIQATDEECMKCGMDGYVSKPFEEEQLYSAAACFFKSGFTELANRNSFVLLLRMDLQMPEMDGFEATRQIHRVESVFKGHWHTPILAMTADVIQATDEECMKCGMDGYVSKPFEEEQLYSAAACFF